LELNLALLKNQKEQGRASQTVRFCTARRNNAVIFDYEVRRRRALPPALVRQLWLLASASDQIGYFTMRGGPPSMYFTLILAQGFEF
jgi:hypothetical protein